MLTTEFIDTHCHINMMIKKQFDVLLQQNQLDQAQAIITHAHQAHVKIILNVGTSLIESMNCVQLARQYSSCYASIGIHPNDCTSTWHDDLKEMKRRWFTEKNYKDSFKIVAIGEVGIDKHYPDYNLQRQRDAFKAHIELALEYNLPIIVHTRDAADETLSVLDEYKKNNLKGVIHCFSEDQSFADHAIQLGFVLGIGGPLTYPKNNELRDIFSTIPLEKVVLETDAPFLPIQAMRGKQNSPYFIKDIADYLAQLRNISTGHVGQVTSGTAKELFGFY